MADIPSIYEGLIQEEECQFKAAVGEYTQRRMGSNLNFIHDYHIFEHAFKMNGPVGAFAGRLGVDGLFVFPYDAEITDVIIYRETPGSSGAFEADILRSNFPNSGFSTIFSQRPIITSGAAAYTTCGVGDVVTGVTAPILQSLPLQVSAKDRLRMDIISMESGFPENAGVLIKYRPR